MDITDKTSNDIEEDEEKEILYEFITYAEWPLETELMVKSDSYNGKGRHGSRILNAFWSKLNSLKGYLSADVIALNNGRLAWQVAVDLDGKFIAVLQDTTLEIRSSMDEFASVIGSNSVKKDLYPNWRRLSWSSDGNFLAVGYSDGTVECFDSAGIRLFTISPTDNSNYDLSDALVDIVFIETRITSGSKWVYELLFINYRGQLRSYFISRIDYELSHTFNFKQTITAAVYHPKFNVLFCGGPVNSVHCSNKDDPISAITCGIFTWRLLNNSPFYRQSLTVEQEMNMENQSGFFRKVSTGVFGFRSENEIFKMILSPSGNRLAVIHVSGTISIWNVPSMRLFKRWTLEEQPKYERESSFGINSLVKPQDFKVLGDCIADLSWWSDKAVIIGRHSGGVSVASVIYNLKNLLGDSVEWFESQPLLTSAFDGRFLVLECELQMVSRRTPKLNDSSEGTEEPLQADNSSDEENESSNMLKSALFYITDSERFRPLRKKPRLTSKTYRLICLRSTTPEQLFLSKLDDEQFGEALALAQTYGLDGDLVYERQWRNSEYSNIAIQDYLSKIKKRSWVLQECLERVPTDIDSMRALLQFGLQGTEINILVNIGKGISSGNFIQEFDDDTDDEEFDDDTVGERKKNSRKEELIKEFNFGNLTMDQKHLCRCRLKLLQYLDRLNTYEVMLGGPTYSYENYDSTFFTNFRSQSAVEATVQFARLSNWQGVSAMFTYHGKETLPHRLAILSNFPETTSPEIYRSLLPEAGFYEEELYIYKWEEENTRSSDWIELAANVESYGLEMKAEDIVLYQERPDLFKFIGFEESPLLLSTWYIERAFEIEENCRLVSYALDLIRLGMERNVQNLEDLYDELVTMEVLVYECGIDELLTLKKLQSLTNMDKLHLLMLKSTASDIVKHVKQWAIPFLSRCEKKLPGCSQKLMNEYMIELSVHQLQFCAKIFSAAPPHQHFVAQTTVEFVSLALDCIYTYEDDQLDSAITIFECIPHRGFGIISKEMEALYDKVYQLEKHLNAVKIFKKYNLTRSIAYVRRCQSEEQEIKNILTLLTRGSCRKDSTFGEAQLKDLLEDIVHLQASVFYKLDINSCVEIFVESLLSSGRSDYIDMASVLLKCKSSPYPKSGQLSSALYTLPQQQGIPKDRSIYLIISVAKGYFNSSSGVDDPSMNLARQCLTLVDDPDESVSSELDLIDSLKILNYFGVELLPFKVRMCANRLDLIRNIFETDPSAYREARKLMTLAHHLRVGQDTQKWQEQVLILIATAALKAYDYVACCNACQQLMSNKYLDGWEVCFDLGRCELFDDVTVKRDLLTFSSVYCPSEQLELVVKIKLSLEGYILKQKLQKQLEMFRRTSNQANSDAKDSSAVGNLSTQIQQLTSTTKHALSVITGSKLLKEASSWLPPLWQTEAATGIEEIAGFNILFTKYSVPTFYMSCIPNSIECPIFPDYRRYVVPNQVPTLSVSFHVMSLVLMTWNDSNDTLPLPPNILQQIVPNLLPLDSMLGLACVMAVPDPAAVDECFKSLPNTDACVQLAIYLFSLRICQQAGLVSKSKLYLVNSEIITQRAERYAKLHRKTEENFVLKQCCEFLQYYVKKREDFAQAKMLLSLGKGVDVIRFGCDEQYRFETVLGLVMTTDDKVFKVAISLAERYQMDEWELFMTHLEYLFNEDDLKLSDLEQRVNKLQLISKLLERPEIFKERMNVRVYAAISGIDHNRLYYFYSLVSQCQPASNDDRLSLLKKLRPIAKGLDFKALLHGKDVLNVLKETLTSNNVKKIAKLVAQISKCCQQELTPSDIYRIFAVKCFIDGIGTETNDSPAEATDWISRYNICKDYFEFINPSDLTQFLDETLFMMDPFEKIPQNVRMEILNRALRFSKQEFKRSKEGSSQILEWKEAVDYINQAKSHLNWLQSENISNLVDNGDPIIKQFIEQLKTTHSNDKLKTLLLQYVINGYSWEQLQSLFTICPPTSSLQLSEIVSEAFSIVRSSFSGEKSQYSSLLINCNLVEVLQKMLDSINNLQSEEMSVNEINNLETVYKNDLIDTSVRLKLMDMIETKYIKDDEKLKSLKGYKLIVMIDQTWPNFKISDENMFNSTEAKESLFGELLSISQNLEQAECLKRILLSWPALPTENDSDISINPWCRLMCFMLSTKSEGCLDSINNCLREMSKRTTTLIEGVEIIFDKVSNCGNILKSLKFCLLTKNEKLHKKVLEDLRHHSDKILELDDEDCQLLIKHQLVPHSISTFLYKPLVDYVIKHKDFDFVKKLALLLQQNGYPVEAASLLMKKTSASRNLQTFSSALGLMKRWL
ncbi:hypothetical protein CHUAL_000414 [Chamberlinius hualienensis]